MLMGIIESHVGLRTYHRRRRWSYTLGRNIGFQGVGLAVLRISKIDNFYVSLSLCTSEIGGDTHHLWARKWERNCSWQTLRQPCRSTPLQWRWNGNKIRKLVLHWRCFCLGVKQSISIVYNLAHFVTAMMYKLFVRTWKKLVEPSVMIGERTSLLDTTWMRNTSAIERLHGKFSVLKSLTRIWDHTLEIGSV